MSYVVVDVVNVVDVVKSLKLYVVVAYVVESIHTPALCLGVCYSSVVFEELFAPAGL